MKHNEDNNAGNRQKENTGGRKRSRSVSEDPAPGINHGPVDGNATTHQNENSVKRQRKKTEAPNRKRKRGTGQRRARKKQRISDTKSKTKSPKQNIAETKSNPKNNANRQKIANVTSKVRSQKKKVSDTNFRARSQKEIQSCNKPKAKSKTIADIRSKAGKQKNTISDTKSKARTHNKSVSELSSRARSHTKNISHTRSKATRQEKKMLVVKPNDRIQQQTVSCTKSKARSQENSYDKFKAGCKQKNMPDINLKARNRMQTRLQTRNQKRDNYDLRSHTRTSIGRIPDTTPKEQRQNQKLQTLNPFQSLPWCHVIWQQVLPYMSVADKFRLRAVNTHCKGVVERDFSMVLSLGPPHTPPLPRPAWKILTASNRCATRFAVPVIIRGAKTELLCRPFNTHDVYKVLVNLPALQTLDLCRSSIPPTFHFLQAVSELVPGLRHLYLNDVSGMARSRQTHRHSPILWLNKWLCRLTNENLQALAFFKLQHLHTLVLSRNRNNLTMATLRAIVNNQTSLRYLCVDPFPLLQRKRGDVAEVADIFRTSGLVLLALTRIPQHDTSCLHRVCSYRPCPAPVNNVTQFDVIFHKEGQPTGQTTLRMFYPSCCPRGEFEEDPKICVPEEELTAKGIQVQCVPCSLEFHNTWRLAQLLP